jgi:drug/metabolite transporter (DMT)-like permease
MLAPLIYVELLGAALIGYLAFSEIPGVTTIAGAALIVLAGSILLQRRTGDRVVPRRNGQARATTIGPMG